jgi:Holliday junction DNA helicase RuvA
MIDSIAGEVVEVGPDYAVIDTGGIAYRAFATATALRELKVGHESLLYTQLIVRDDAMQLFGFASRDERAVFGQLLTVGQVGPKLALQILSSLPLNDLIRAVSTSDVARLTAVKGVGKKTAERILVDLRDKLGAPTGTGSGDFLLSTGEETALLALTSKLGYSAREAREALQKLRGQDLSPEDLVRGALQILGGGG